MPFDRRLFLGSTAALGAGLAATAASAAGPRPAATAAASRPQTAAPASELGLEANSERDQTQRMQAAIDRLAPTGTPLWLPPGRYRTGALTLRQGTRIEGVAGASVLELSGIGALLSGTETPDVSLSGLVLDGGARPLAGGRSGALVSLIEADRIVLSELTVARSSAFGIALTRCSGVVTGCRVTESGETAIFSLDARGLEISHNHVQLALNNGIQVWRSAPGEDGTLVIANRIERVLAANGGTGQNGNGINVFRAGQVMVSSNRITDCAYTAIRANAASNIQMVSNHCARLGEVALYSEFAFQGALIASNVVDDAAAGISVTNFNEGGRLAVVQGNLIRNLKRREFEPEDKRGEGIAVEADAAVTGNVIENAPTAGIMIGWTHWMREVVASSNVIRNARIGIAVTADPGAGAVMISNNMISGAREGAIRGMQKAVPVGPDLAKSPPSSARVAVVGNVAV